jgi:hypothetical protein
MRQANNYKDKYRNSTEDILLIALRINKTKFSHKANLRNSTVEKQFTQQRKGKILKTRKTMPINEKVVVKNDKSDY